MAKGSKQSKTTRALVRREVNNALTRNLERKYHQEDDPDQSIPNSGVIIDMAPIPIGTYATQRVGNAIKPVSLQLRGMIKANDDVNFVRQIIFVWLEDSFNVLPQMSDILEETAGTYQKIYTCLNRQNLNKSFKVLTDKVYHMSNNTANPDFNRYRLFNFNLTRGLRKISFNGSSTEGTNKLYCLYVSDSTVTPDPELWSMATLNYKDI